MICAVHAPLGVPMPTTTTNVIPPITDPLGLHWDQPDTSNFLIDDTHVVMTLREFNQLAEYSTTNPSGVYVGKCWKAALFERVEDGRMRSTGEWVLRWFGHDPDPKFCSNNHRRIIITN
jgi:hypothetical protein